MQTGVFLVQSSSTYPVFCGLNASLSVPKLSISVISNAYWSSLILLNAFYSVKCVWLNIFWHITICLVDFRPMNVSEHSWSLFMYVCDRGVTEIFGFFSRWQVKSSILSSRGNAVRQETYWSKSFSHHLVLLWATLPRHIKSDLLVSARSDSSQPTLFSGPGKKREGSITDEVVTWVIRP